MFLFTACGFGLRLQSTAEVCGYGLQTATDCRMLLIGCAPFHERHLI
ncbi:MAG: hypothetical protein RBQ94_05020 [Methanimicrococcus sp.]|nr:hypothetical protein [Methanimicrococcus sp.]